MRPRVRVQLPLALVSLAALLAGCTSSAHCGPTDGVVWRDAAVYAALPGEPVMHDVGAAVAGPWSETRVQHVSWSQTGSRSGVGIELADDGTLWAAAPVGANGDRLREDLVSFVESVSAADAAQREAWVDTMLGAAEDSGFSGDGRTVVQHSYQTRIAPPYRFGELVSSLGGWNATTRVDGFPGAASLAFEGGWHLRVATPQKAASFGDVRITADELGLASASRPRDQATPKEESRTAIAEALRALGVEPPPLGDEQLLTEIC